MEIKLTLRNFGLSALIISLIFCALVYPAAISKGIIDGINLCLKLLIPSLFFFMVISALFVRTGLSETIGQFLNPITQFLFGLPGISFSVILLGLIGGYPTGAKTAMSLFEMEKITEKQAENLTYFCFGSGPAFAITVTGSVLFKNTFLGVLIFISQIFSALILGIIFKFSNQYPKIIKRKNQAIQKLSFSESIVISCSDATETMFSMCTMVILFSAILSLIEVFGITNPFLKLFLEVTSGVAEATQMKIPPEIITFCVTFGGICVHLQIFSIISKSNNKSKINFSCFKFLICRLFCAFLASTFIFLSLKLFKNTTPVFISNNLEVTNGIHYINETASLTLIFMCFSFLFSKFFDRIYFCRIHREKHPQ